MGGTQRLAAVAAVSHARQYYNHTQPEVVQTQSTHYTVNIFFVSATLCGVLVAVCAACWRRSPATDKPEDTDDARRGVYTVSGDAALAQVQSDLPGPPPAYETVVDVDIPSHHKADCIQSQVVADEPCCQCRSAGVSDSELPSYEAAVMLKDTKL